jgi:anthranilate phosphoribosyltransferase
VVELRDGAFREFTVTPEEAGIALAPPRRSAAATRRRTPPPSGPCWRAPRALTGRWCGLNAAAALIVAGAAATLREGAALAASSIDSGAAMLALTRLQHATSRDD